MEPVIVERKSEISRLKRTSCVLCRTRKLKCDRAQPICSSCGRLGHRCQYDETRIKSGPKKGYVRSLETRVEQLETRLRAYEEIDGHTKNNPTLNPSVHVPDLATSFSDVHLRADFAMPRNHSVNANVSGQNMIPRSNLSHHHETDIGASRSQNLDLNMSDLLQADFDFDDLGATWTLISLGLEEPLPPDEAVSELTELYFSKVHHTLPFINRAKFLSSMLLPPKMKPPVALRYAMWSVSAAKDFKYTHLHEVFYERARRYLQADETRGFGQETVSLAHCQAWVLISTYEYQNLHFPKSWLSAGRATRLAQMLGLHKLDGNASGAGYKRTIPETDDWLELEERRRTFWMCFWVERYASIGTGWPMIIDEKDVTTKLPASEEAFQSGIPEDTATADEALRRGAGNLSVIAVLSLIMVLFGRSLHHVHRATPGDAMNNISNHFWQRHRELDRCISHIRLSISTNLRMPFGLSDPNVPFLEMCLHTCLICIHQLAVVRVDQSNLLDNLGQDSRIRCLAAAEEVTNTLRQISQSDLSLMNPFMPFCLYVSARVFIQALKARRHDQYIVSSLHFVLQNMYNMQNYNKFSIAFIPQLEVDMEAIGLPNPCRQCSTHTVEVTDRSTSTPNQSHRSTLATNLTSFPQSGDASCMPLHGAGAHSLSGDREQPALNTDLHSAAPSQPATCVTSTRGDPVDGDPHLSNAAEPNLDDWLTNMTTVTNPEYDIH